MRMVLGSEVEYGIGVRGQPANPVALSEGVVVRVPGLGLGHLDRMLGNGARVYVDHAHPEYSGPECGSATDVLTWELAGDQLMAAAAHRLSVNIDAQVVLHRNNTDGKGRSYGYHENYLLPRELAWDDIVDQVTGHLVSRVVLVGAGRVGLGQQGEQPGFQTSQRADFMEALQGIETTVRRPLVNTRDEPHADPAQWRRLHVITGDATMAQVATLVKVGATALVLAAITAGGARVPRLVDPLTAIREFSRDTSLTVTQPCDDGLNRSALDLQWLYWQVASAHADALPDGDLVLEMWQELISDARSDPRLLADRVDWAAKLALLTGLQRRHGWDWTSPGVAAVDLQWHELDDQRGLALMLERAGRLRRLVDQADIDRAHRNAPGGTRAAVRAALLAGHEGHVARADWAQLTLAGGEDAARIHLPDPFTGHPA
ncbi:proteasome accessory factor PafA2 family protein [Propionibacteriaceae bacterium Y1923]